MNVCFGLKYSKSNRGEERVHNIIDLIRGGCFPPFHPNCRCTYLTVWSSKEEPPEDPYIINLTPNYFKRIVDVSYYDDPKFNSYDEYKEISKKGYIEYADRNGIKHKIKVNCYESSTVKFDNESEIGEKLDDEACYKYELLDEKNNILVTVYKSKNNNQFSMEHLVNIYDNLNKELIKNCDEIVVSNQKLKEGVGGFVIPSEPNRVHIMGSTDYFSIEPVLIHEIAHSFDISNGYLSNSKKYKELVKKYPLDENVLDTSDSHYFSEDFAYSVEKLMMHPDTFFKMFPEKTIYLYKLLGIIK